MKNPTEFSSTGSFNIAEIAASLPETATTLLVDQYLTNRDAGLNCPTSNPENGRLPKASVFCRVET
jgi:hypothetical protein